MCARMFVKLSTVAINLNSREGIGQQKFESQNKTKTNQNKKEEEFDPTNLLRHHLGSSKLRGSSSLSVQAFSLSLDHHTIMVMVGGPAACGEVERRTKGMSVLLR
eukprot:c19382_g1_i1.p1 GENE.c19382_g1_i1~~c19382_g1_i1.p1  ORF type:complete len:105 (-),score=22.46 c19382_g1_i1:82-396(-)